jgi:hypothetical protein
MFILITALCAVCVGLIAWGFTGPNRSLRFASLMGASMAGFAVPQVIGESNARVLTEPVLAMFVLMTILCMGCAFAGDLLGYRRRGKRIYPLGDYDDRRVMEAALILNCVAFLASIWIQLAFREEIERARLTPGGMSGPMTIAIFFSAVHRYGYALALLIYWRRRTGMALAMIFVGVAIYMSAILAGSRRGPAMELIFISLLTFAVARRKQIPALVITVLFVGGTLWSTAIGEFRTLDDRSFFEKLEAASYLKDFQNILESSGGEVYNGSKVMEYVSDNDAYDHGRVHWNKLVNAFFPGQIFGHDTKEDLKFPLVDVAMELNKHRGTVGIADTGMADCFSSFGYFGCLKYLLIGFVMGRWYRRAFDGDLAAQLAYSTLITGALHTISHGTSWLLNEFIHLAIFSYPLLYWARKPAVVSAVRRLRPRPFGSPLNAAPGLR